MIEPDIFYIFGAGGHAKAIRELAVDCNTRDIIVHFVVKDRMNINYSHPEKFILEEDFFNYPSGTILLGIGNNVIRSSIFHTLRSSAHLTHLPHLLHPTTLTSRSSSYGDGSVVLLGSIIQAGTSIGVGVIVNSGCIIEHDCKIDDFVLVGSGTILGGGVSIGALTTIGVGATVKPGVKIGENVTIGAGSVVISDIPANCRVAGVPAKRIK